MTKHKATTTTLSANYQFARVETDTLTDDSTAYNVVLDGEGHARITIGATDREHAQCIADAINEGAAWVQA